MSAHPRGRAPTCASSNIPGFNPAEMPAATAARASPIVLRRTPPRKPSRCFQPPRLDAGRHVAAIAGSVGRDSTSPSTETMTREMPGPSRSPGSAYPHLAIELDRAVAVIAKLRRRQVAARRDRIETDWPTPSPLQSTSAAV